MNMTRTIMLSAFVTVTALSAQPSFAEGKFHCELTKDGKKSDIPEAKNKKQCNE